jgi:hypothetical protein
MKARGAFVCPFAVLPRESVCPVSGPAQLPVAKRKALYKKYSVVEREGGIVYSVEAVAPAITMRASRQRSLKLPECVAQ